MFITYHSLIHSKHFLGCQLYTSQDVKNKDIRDINIKINIKIYKNKDIQASSSHRGSMWREKRENN